MSSARLRKSPPPQGPIARGIARLRAFFLEDIWRENTDDLGFPVGHTFKVLRVAQLAVRGIVVHRATFTSSALTYTTILSLVPLLAFAFSVAKGMGAYERLRDEVIEPFLTNNLGGFTDEATPESIVSLREAIDSVLELVSNTDVSSLGLLGLAILVIAVIRVLSNIEDVFNRIWGVRRARTPVRRVADYLSLAVVTPLMLVLAVGITQGAQNSLWAEWMRNKSVLAPMVDGFFSFTPLLAMWISFTLLYILLPNTTVSPFSALLGGIMGGTLWHLAQIGHVKFQVGIANYNAIYSSFAAFPIFLVWIYVSWVTVIFGAEFAHAHQTVGHHRQLVLFDPREHRHREMLALRACVRVARRFMHGGEIWRANLLADELGVPQVSLERVLAHLVDAGILAEGQDREWMTYLPARDPDSITVAQILDALKGEAEDWRMNAISDHDEELVAIYGELKKEFMDSPSNRRLSDLVEETPNESS